MKRKSIIYLAGLIVAVVVVYFVFSPDDKSSQETIVVPVKTGEFVINVTTTGELEAKNSQNIFGPNASKMRRAGMWNYKIDNIIDDGTVIKKGDYVARIDPSELEKKIKDLQLEEEKRHSAYIKTQLDTTMTLREARNSLINLKFELEQKQINLDQSKYEPPATKRQAKIDLEKAERSYEQATTNYVLKQKKAVAEMVDVIASLNKSKMAVKSATDLLGEFMILAPQDGMLIYQRDWDGKRIGKGSSINVWSNVVATLPDLSQMVTKTYVNEIDISKISKDQNVDISIDAFPDKKLKGIVTNVANIGQQLQGSNAKVFEVMVEVVNSDTNLRPAMTTQASIITDILQDTKYIPLDAVDFQDSTTLVYKTNGSRQEIITGPTNDNEIVVYEGLESTDEIYILPPKNANDWKLNKIPDAIHAKYNAKQKKDLKPVVETSDIPIKEAE
ncbi:MAG: efflux RND transporter periplasmic adaptor subunit [Hyphomicrobiales bacterium]